MHFDEMKGRAKEAAGKMTGDRDLQREGKVDRAAGKFKEAVDRVKDAVTGRGRPRRGRPRRDPPYRDQRY